MDTQSIGIIVRKAIVYPRFIIYVDVAVLYNVIKTGCRNLIYIYIVVSTIFEKLTRNLTTRTSFYDF